MMYTTYVNNKVSNEKYMLRLEGLHDRALIYGNGEYLGCYMRDRDMPPILFDVPDGEI